MTVNPAGYSFVQGPLPREQVLAPIPDTDDEVRAVSVHDPCRCGHGWNDHRDPEPAPCQQCGCPEFYEPPTPDPAPRVLVDEADRCAACDGRGEVPDPDTSPADCYGVQPMPCPACAEADLRAVPLRDRLTEQEREDLDTVVTDLENYVTTVSDDAAVDRLRAALSAATRGGAR